MSLTSEFKRFAKDAVKNFGDFMVTGEKINGLAMAGLPEDAKREAAASSARIAARKAARHESKPS